MKKKNLNLNQIVFLVLLTMSTLVTAVLFYRQAMYADRGYDSDINVYIEEMCGKAEGYLFPYPILFKAGAFINMLLSNPKYSMVLSLTLFNVAAIIIVFWLYRRELGDSIVVSVVSVSLFFVSMIFSEFFKKLGVEHYYLGVWTPNPWHNGTFLAARPFMILAFYYCVKVLEEFDRNTEDGNIKDRIFTGLFLFLTTLTKPSYAVIHFLALGIWELMRIFKYKGTVIKEILILACIYIPTIIAMLYQYIVVYINGDEVYSGEQGIGIGFMNAWGLYTNNLLLAVVLAIGFPLIVLLFNHNQLKKDYEYKFSWILYLVALLTVVFLYEKGAKGEHFNFGWGYMASLFILYYTSAKKLISETIFTINSSISLNKVDFRLLIMWIYFLLHLGCGIIYFFMLINGIGYMI